MDINCSCKQRETGKEIKFFKVKDLINIGYFGEEIKDRFYIQGKSILSSFASDSHSTACILQLGVVFGNN